MQRGDTTDSHSRAAEFTAIQPSQAAVIQCMAPPSAASPPHPCFFPPPPALPSPPQKHIDFALNSPFGGGRPGRVKRRSQASKKGGGGDDGGEDEE